MKVRKKVKLIHGFGINDADYVVRRKVVVDGKATFPICKFYSTWSNMIARCYSEAYHKRQPTYIGCTVCEEWKYFSNFKAWMEKQDYLDKELDKDFLVDGNKLYSPETCIFLEKRLNLFLNEMERSKGQWPSGVCRRSNTSKFQASCRDPFEDRIIHLGNFDTAEEAHTAWKEKKKELAVKYAEFQTDPRLKHALLTKYL